MLNDRIISQPIFHSTTLPAVARCLGGTHRQRGVEAERGHPQRERSRARVRRELRHDAQGAGPDGGRAPAHAPPGPRHVRQRPVLRRAGGALQQHPRRRRQARLRQVKSLDVTEGPANEIGVRAAAAAARGPRLSHPPRAPAQGTGRSWSRTSRCRPRCFLELAEDKKRRRHRIIVLAQEYGILLGKAEERISLGGAPRGRPELGVAAGPPVHGAGSRRAALDGRPIEWRMGWCHLADRYYMAEMSDARSLGGEASETYPLQSASALAQHVLAYEVSTCPFRKLPARLRASPSST